MSKRQVIILWAIALLFGALVLVVKLTQSDPAQLATERKPGDTLFESFPATEVASVKIKGARQSITLRKSGEHWVIAERDDYPADTTAVLGLIRTLSELEVKRAVEANPSYASRFGMDPKADSEDNHGLVLSFFDKTGAPLAAVTLGKNLESNASTGMPGTSMLVGRWLRNHDDPSGIYATTEMFPAVTDEASSWLRDTFISPEKIQSVSVTKPDSEELAWKLERKTEEAAFQVVDGAPNEVANASMANRLGSLLSYARFEDVVPNAEVDERKAESGTRTAVIETFEGFTYTLVITPAASSTEEYLMQAEVAAELPEVRKKPEGETEQQARMADKAFTDRRQQLQDKLNEAKFFQGRTYLMSKSDLALLLNPRGEMVTVVQPPEPPASIARPEAPAEPTPDALPGQP